MRTAPSVGSEPGSLDGDERHGVHDSKIAGYPSDNLVFEFVVHGSALLQKPY